ncbi:hypothetical protein STEG23_011950, partial [Scotinomys teguina]
VSCPFSIGSFDYAPLRQQSLSTMADSRGPLGDITNMEGNLNAFQCEVEEEHECVIEMHNYNAKLLKWMLRNGGAIYTSCRYKYKANISETDELIVNSNDQYAYDFMMQLELHFAIKSIDFNCNKLLDEFVEAKDCDKIFTILILYHSLDNILQLYRLKKIINQGKLQINCEYTRETGYITTVQKSSQPDLKAASHLTPEAQSREQSKMMKGTSFFRKHRNKTHMLCRRCGSKPYHLQKSTCGKCGYPAKPKR